MTKLHNALATASGVPGYKSAAWYSQKIALFAMDDK
jgi:hypothetical protein